MNKLTSGRFVFTLITAIVFLYSVVFGILNNEQVVSIIMLVVAFYFNKKKGDTDV